MLSAQQFASIETGVVHLVYKQVAVGSSNGLTAWFHVLTLHGCFICLFIFPVVPHLLWNCIFLPPPLNGSDALMFSLC